MTFLFFLLAIKHFLPFPYQATPDPEDIFHRLLCRGWSCNEDLYPQHQADEFNDILDMYANGTLNVNLESKIRQLIRREYHPAKCAAGFFSLFGLANFSKNLTESYIELKEGSEFNLWSCHEALAFHPYEKDQIGHLRAASARGAILSSLRLAIITKNETESVDLLRHIATIQTAGWWRKRRSGIEYSDAIAKILRLHEAENKEAEIIKFDDDSKSSSEKTHQNHDDGNDVRDAWATIDRMSGEGHLPAAIWAAEGLKTGEIGRKSLAEARAKLLPIVVSGPWRIDVASVVESDDTFDKVGVLKLAALLGNTIAEPLISFPQAFK
ncbi:hypothetical protein TRFO_24750 [Tritrichomonas foetus]|uniref:Uncharacterized protein n=1 Tax=Tritrichomonas foetus TaxID=1144522 RepID=A0A1J4K6D9_9EUKA|nr:hypothetical protein TRFO_24750 [Tritrichomonas foetus]|eukprot:OHT07025.1 hypothetical protein TRFO_24750 [Tritrichomonas foetus]